MSLQIHQFESREILIARKESILGRGAYGIVHQGFHKSYGDVAVKCSIINGGTKVEEKIKEEMEHLQRASHENVVRIFGWTITMKTIAIVMEFLPGGTLLELLMDDDVPLAPRLRLRFCAEIASGIAFIHNLPGKRMIHGDVKPENILLTIDLHCKLADFGEARVSSYTGDPTLTADLSRNNKCTLLYAAPELLRGSVGKRQTSQDTYSYAITVYAILSRRLPITSEYDLPIYLEGVKMNQRPNISDIKEWEKSLFKSGHSTDGEIVQLMLEVMQSCWNHSSSLRPRMLSVKEELINHLNQCHPSEMHDCVTKATKNIEFCTPSRRNERVPLDQVVSLNAADIQDMVGMSSLGWSETDIALMQNDVDVQIQTSTTKIKSLNLSAKETISSSEVNCKTKNRLEALETKDAESFPRMTQEKNNITSEDVASTSYSKSSTTKTPDKTISFSLIQKPVVKSPAKTTHGKIVLGNNNTDENESTPRATCTNGGFKGLPNTPSPLAEINNQQNIATASSSPDLTQCFCLEAHPGKEIAQSQPISCPSELEHDDGCELGVIIKLKRKR